MASYESKPGESSLPGELVDDLPLDVRPNEKRRGQFVEHPQTGLSRIHHSAGSSFPPEQSPLWVDQGGLKPSSLGAYLEIPFIHKWLICLCTLLGLMLGWFAIMVWPRTYESQAKLMVRVGRESVSLDPTATTSATLTLQKTQEEEIVSALEVLNSRQVAQVVTNKIGADAIISGYLPKEGDATEPSFVDKAKSTLKNGVFHLMLAAGLKDDISNNELAVMRVSNGLWTHSPRKSNVIIVESHAKTPEMAQAIVEEATQSFLDLHLENAHTVGSYTFFNDQAESAEQELNGLIGRRSEFMQARKLVSIASSRALIQQRLGGIDRDLVLATGQLEEAMSSVTDLQKKYAGTDDEIVAAKVAASDSTWSGMRQQVYTLEVAEQNLAANYTDDHPKLKQVRTQLEGARGILAELESERVDESRTPNPAKAKLLGELQAQETRVVGLRSKIAEKRRQQKAMQEQTDNLLDYERELSQIDREISMAEGSLKSLQEKLEEARVIDELQTNKISNVSVFQPATLIERAVSPKKPLLGAAFLLLGFTGGLGLSVLRQATSSTLRTSDDVENQLGCPVVSSLPRISRVNSPRLNDQKRYKEQCQTLISEILLSQRRSGSPHGRSVGVIGVDLGAGASTLSTKLATACASDCRLRTVLVDGDTRGRSVSRSFKLNGKPGLVELVSGSASHDECLQTANGVPMQLISSAADSCDDVLNNNAPEIVQSLQAYLEDCDLLIVDLPAASQPDQAIAVAQHLDCVLVVVESEKTQSAAADRLLRRLAESDTEVIGVVLNKTRNYLPVWLRRSVGYQA